MMDKVIALLQDKPLLVPRILFRRYKEFKLTEQELILLIYLLNEENTAFNPKKISDDTGYPLNEVLELINSIISKDCLSFSIVKNGTNGYKRHPLDKCSLFVNTKKPERNYFSLLDYEVFTNCDDNNDYLNNSNDNEDIEMNGTSGVNAMWMSGFHNGFSC